MAKRVVKDIQIKRKQPAAKQTPAVRIEEKEKPFIPEEKPAGVSYTPIPRKQPRALWRAVFFILLGLLTVGLLFWGVYAVSSATVSVTVKELQQPVHESVTLTSWTYPLKSTVMTVQKSQPLLANAENMDTARQETQKTIEDSFIYDLPKDYLLFPGCKTELKQAEIKEDGENGKVNLVSSSSALVLEKKSLEEYLLRQLRLKDMIVKDSSNLTCSLKTDITAYNRGESAQNLAFIIEGSIIAKPAVAAEYLKTELAGKTVSAGDGILASDERIVMHRIDVWPLAFFPLLPKNPEKIKIIYEN